MRERSLVWFAVAVPLLVVAATAVVVAGDPVGQVEREEGLPSLRRLDLDGEIRSLDEWRGRVVLLNFWASWCPPCQYEIPDFVRWQAEHGERGLQVVSVGLDAPRKLANVRRTLGINYPVMVASLEDPGNRGLLERWGNDSGILPYTVVIDRAGNIVRRHKGRFGDVEFRRYVQPLLAR